MIESLSAVRLLDFFERLARRHAGTAASRQSLAVISNPWGQFDTFRVLPRLLNLQTLMETASS